MGRARYTKFRTLPRTAQDEQVGQGVDHIDGIEFAFDADHQGPLRELIDDIERAIYPSVVGPILDEVVGPDMVRALRSEPDA